MFRNKLYKLLFVEFLSISKYSLQCGLWMNYLWQINIIALIRNKFYPQCSFCHHSWLVIVFCMMYVHGQNQLLSYDSSSIHFCFCSRDDLILVTNAFYKAKVKCSVSTYVCKEQLELLKEKCYRSIKWSKQVACLISHQNVLKTYLSGVLLKQFRIRNGNIWFAN